MKRFIVPLLVLFLFLGFLARLYRFDNPIADWHSWRQADTSSVSRNFVTSGFDVLHPKYDDLSNVASKKDNPNGYRFVEFPIYNVLQGGLYKIFGIITLEEWGRLVTIFSSLTSAVLIFLILKKRQNETSGLIGAFFFSLLPYSIYYGRTILPDTSTAMATLAGIYFFDKWVSGKKITNFILSIIFVAVALLLKPFAIFFLLPIMYMFYEEYGLTLFKKAKFWIFTILSVTPLVAWRIWISQYPEGIPLSAWLFNEGGIRFKGAFFYWIFGERVAKLMTGYFGLPLLVLGLLSNFKSRRNLLFFLSLLVSCVIYVSVVARGNVQHDYYQILILPTICIFMGLGGDFLLNYVKRYTNKYLGPLVFVILTFLSLFFGWYFVRDYFNINNPSIIAAGKAVDRLTPKNAKVIANYNGDTSFLYQTKRKGWASYEKDLPGMVKLGADYLAIVNPVSGDYIYAKDYQVIAKTPQYAIFDLRKKE